MKKIYASPEVKAIEVKKEDIITNSPSTDYITPTMPQNDSDVNNGSVSD